MLTSIEIIEHSFSIQAASYRSIDHYLVRRYGIDYNELPFYGELKSALEAIMERREVKHPAGYTYYEWIDK